ncbi:hypothetical protein Hbl1158_06810 [Halobaculum sp. CBA1158]|uniref:hypothetical protein n=1 Tax=Halobaculum sp. CBA1158 TaxID=2904243 RepID=UPI001F3E81A0|nr:hypothetical protein [Halobaculum sp. CBA1158]UIP01058.1 hypothetical protein Hbl1158_06810 [Halobaculum sp. CBA1158]
MGRNATVSRRATEDRNDSYDWPQTESDVRRRYAKIDSLHEDIAENGYRTQTELYQTGERVGTGFGNDIGPKGLLERFAHEITVDIGRDGTLLFVDGRHRLAIAKVAEVDRIPVTILVRHETWMEHRDRVIENGRDEDHPDFRDPM